MTFVECKGRIKTHCRPEEKAERKANLGKLTQHPLRVGACEDCMLECRFRTSNVNVWIPPLLGTAIVLRITLPLGWQIKFSVNYYGSRSSMNYEFPKAKF